jgi:hypothetical protein
VWAEEGQEATMLDRALCLLTGAKWLATRLGAWCAASS